jgi:hypothetical protein
VRWLRSSGCFWAGPTGLVSKRSIKRFYFEKSCAEKTQYRSIVRLLVNELKIRDANGDDVVEELCALRLQECKIFPPFTVSTHILMRRLYLLKRGELQRIFLFFAYGELTKY